MKLNHVTAAITVLALLGGFTAAAASRTIYPYQQNDASGWTDGVAPAYHQQRSR
jgi:hypothetical protein